MARHSETLEELVVYRALYMHEIYGNDSLLVGPKTMFLEIVFSEGREVLRFTPIK